MARLHGQGIASYPEFAQASTGGASFPPFAVVNESASQTNPNARLQFGDALTDKFGNVYLYVRAAIALAVGQVVRFSVTGDSSSDHPAAGTISASTTTKRIFTNITTTINEATIGSFLASQGASAAATGTPFFKPIKKQVAIGSNTTFDISLNQTLVGIGFDGDALSAIPTTSDAVSVIRPFNVVVHGAAAGTTMENAPVGVALGTVSQASGTLILVQGNGMVLGVGNGAAIVAGGPIVAAASGTVKGPGTAAAGLDQDELPSYVGRSYVAYTSTSKQIPAHIRCLKNI